MDKTSKLLRIYTDESAFFGDQRLFEFIAALARERRMAGMTVLEAMLGFGRSAHMHRSHAFENDRAVVIEIVDEEGALRDFAARLGDVPDIGLITIEAVEVLGGEFARPVERERFDGASA
jgi:PII-like signaling protein